MIMTVRNSRQRTRADARRPRSGDSEKLLRPILTPVPECGLARGNCTTKLGAGRRMASRGRTSPARVTYDETTVRLLNWERASRHIKT